MRVTQNYKYSALTSDLNSSLSSVMDSQNQMLTQRKVNRPSDDPAGSGRVVSIRADIARLGQYSSNISTATGWLSSADSTLLSTQELLTKIKTLAQQGADGTKTAENRRQIAFELRENFMQLINLANTKYSGESIFAGHKTDGNAYELALGTTYKDKATSADGKDTATANGSFPTQTQINVTDIVNGKVQYTYSEWDEKNGAWGTPVSLEALDRGEKTQLKLPGSRSLSVDTTNGNLKANKQQTFTVMDPKAAGSTSITTIIQATGDDGSGASGKASDSEVKFRYSTDGGVNWQDATKTINSDNTVTIDAGGTKTTISADAWVEKVDPDVENETRNGTWLFLRPTAQYKGDDHDTQVVTNYGAKATGIADGFFSSDVVVKITNIDPDTKEITYAYSSDNGTNWIEGRKTPLDPEKSKLAIPGGFLTLEGKDGTAPKAGDQYTVHPHRADINLAISDTDSITTNMVGKDIFGGTYIDPITGKNTLVDGGASSNVFETVGRLIGYAESGSQEGMQKALDELQACMDNVLTSSTVLGGRMNRLETTTSAIENQIDNEKTAVSDIEDADLVTLLSELEKRQTAYNYVSKSSAVVMQLSLLNFL